MVTKSQLRAEIATARAAISPEELRRARDAIRDLVLSRFAGAACVCAYVPMRTEPGSIGLLSALAASGSTVLVPVTLPSRDLDWTRWNGDGRPLGRAAIARASVVLVPAFAVAPDGTRLGRGGGSYDRALPRRPPGTPAVALLFDDEFRPSVPAQAWDVPVDAVVTPSGWHPITRPG